MKGRTILRIKQAAALLALGMILPGVAWAQEARQEGLAVVRHANSPPGLILQAVTVRPGATILYLSGQLAAPIDPAKKLAPNAATIADFGDTRTQTISVLEKIKAILASQGYAMSDVIKLTVFVAGDPKLGGKMDFAGMNEGFRQFFGTAENPATVARSTVQVAALVGPQFLVEIEAIAAK
jgi:2-iminobutanoate/2-iminopropanoate deaminase